MGVPVESEWVAERPRQCDTNVGGSFDAFPFFFDEDLEAMMFT